MSKKFVLSAVLAAVIIFSFGGCTNMSRTQQGALSGGLIGAIAGAGISVITGGSVGTGALIGGGVGALAGGLYGHSTNDYE